MSGLEYNEEEEFEGLKLRPSRKLSTRLGDLLPQFPWEGPPIPRGRWGAGRYKVIVKWGDEVLAEAEGIEGFVYPSTVPEAKVVHLDYTVILQLAYKPKFIYRTYGQLYVDTKLFLHGVSDLLYGEVTEKDYAAGWQREAPWIPED